MSDDLNDQLKKGKIVNLDDARPMKGDPHVGVIKSLIHDAPVADDVELPDGYTLTGKWGVWQSAQDEKDSDKMVCRAPLVISGYVVNADDGTVSVRLSWKWLGSWHHAVVPKSQIKEKRRLVRLADVDLPIDENSSGLVVRYLTRFEDVNVHRLPRARVSKQLGWQQKKRERELGVDGFLAGHTLINESGVHEAEIERTDPLEWREDMVAFQASEGEAQLAHGISARGSFEAWADAVACFNQHPKVMIAFYAALATPLLGILGCPNFVIDWAGESSTGKSTALLIAASCWGQADEHQPDCYMMTWDATPVNIERACAVLNDLPLIIDDTKKCKTPWLIPKVIYAFSSGFSKGRGNIRGIDERKSWRGILMSTGEQQMTAFSKDGGTRARCLTFWGIPLGEKSTEMALKVEMLKLSLNENSGHAGPRFVRYLLEHRASWAAWKERYMSRRRTWVERAEGDAIAGRLAAYIALIEEAAHHAHEALGLPFAYEGCVAEVAPELLGAADDGDIALDALEFTINWARGRKHQFFDKDKPRSYLAEESMVSGDRVRYHMPPGSGWLGRWDEGEDRIHIFKDKLQAALEQRKYDYDAVLRTWRDRGWLQMPPSRRAKQKLDQQVRINGGKSLVHTINETAFAAAGLADTPDTPETVEGYPVG